MALATLATAVGAQSTDKRQMSDVVKRMPAVKNWWTLAQRLSYADPASGFPAIKARAGNVDLVANLASTFSPDGGFNIASFVADWKIYGHFGCDLPAMSGKWSFIDICKPIAACRQWGIQMKASTHVVKNTEAAKKVLVHSLAQGTAAYDDRAILADSAIGSRQVTFICIDFTTGAVKGSLNSITPSAETVMPNWAAAAANRDAVWPLTLGAQLRGASFPFNGFFHDFARVQGDVFTMPDVLTAFLNYANTAYSGA